MPGGLIGGGLGALAGSQKDHTEQTSTLNLAPASALQNQSTGTVTDMLNQLTGMVGAGPGQSDVTNAYNSSTSLASLLGQYAQNGGLPSQMDINNSNGIAANMYQAQRVGMQQSFLDQTNQANQSAALMGRDINDPILRAKLAQSQTQQSALLNANQGSFAQQLALQQPYQRLNFAQQQNGILNGLATQAMSNRQALMNLGSGIMTNQQNFQLAQSGRSVNTYSGGGLKGAIMGGMAGSGMGMGAQGMMSQGAGQQGGAGAGGTSGAWGSQGGSMMAGPDASALAPFAVA